MKRKKTLDGFNLSFMDCICCGFGAIILLFVLTVGPIKKTLETKKNRCSRLSRPNNKSIGDSRISIRRGQSQNKENRISEYEPLLKRNHSNIRGFK
jgi:hypothetical protein